MRQHRAFHSCRGERNPRNRIGFGLFVIVLGALALLNNLNVFNMFGMLQFWPVFLIALGGLLLLRGGRATRSLTGGALMGLGALMALDQAGYIRFSLQTWWPALLIYAGLMVILRGERRRVWQGERGEMETSGDAVRANVVMSGSELHNDSQDFKGGSVSVLMGGVKLDLREASIQGEAVLNVEALLGGLQIRVPTDWAVEIELTPVMGGVENRAVPPPGRDKRLRIRGEALMSGVEVRN